MDQRPIVGLWIDGRSLGCGSTADRWAVDRRPIAGLWIDGRSLGCGSTADRWAVDRRPIAGLWIDGRSLGCGQERYKRVMADSDNVRRRTQKFVQDAKLFGIQSFCRDLVEVADLLKQTTGNVQGEEDQRLAQIKDRLQGVFTKHGLMKMSPVGAKYDPYQHEIVCHTPAEGWEPGTVAVVKHDGYKLHGRTIRHAQVGIAVMTQEQD
ncbi:grpE protein homolog 2, mitochondrial isoform X4 [Salvelinus namaycush]|uniref:GrpE protein homolog 2, mitochondrial isoform X4 n=1 Tax=Salvelinus namaycush TaxID=8040 RepID=A0A8U1BSB0_SALNM|nr:grpE protein homolog 2, mitochondrial isoform X4 [Salvelinus namaycush]XP_038861019.1 grpE protein homolog 2, mitochondrial isoform X4 [Salvelinus namaycush]